MKTICKILEWLRIFAVIAGINLAYFSGRGVIYNIKFIFSCPLLSLNFKMTEGKEKRTFKKLKLKGDFLCNPLNRLRVRGKFCLCY